MRKSTMDRLRDLGFDRSYHIRFTSKWRIRCSQCEAATINGTPCHESGCPNQRPKRRRDDE